MTRHDGIERREEPMFVELHLLQSFAPSNLNRDDSGAPKQCIFGGVRRARISSQCVKRATRMETGFQEFMEGAGGKRTKRIVREIAERIAGRPAPDDALKKVAAVFQAAGLEQDNDATSRIILFLGEPGVERMVEAFGDRWNELKPGKADPKSELVKNLAVILKQSAAVPDIALFGRMIEVKGNTPFGQKQLGVDSAVQVAHPISTHAVDRELDYFTGVDDFKRSDTDDAGAGMLGTTEFNAACYYRYANVDVEQLKENLGDDEDQAKRTIEAFVRATIEAVPSGKQHAFAAQNPPSFIFAVVRERRLWSLANAFCKPVSVPPDGDLVAASTAALDRYWSQLLRMYGERGVAERAVVALDDLAIGSLKEHWVPSVDELIARVLHAVRFVSTNAAAA